jgi:hypothetical protein
LPADAETARVDKGVIHGNENLAVKLIAAGVFLMVEGDDVRRALMAEEVSLRPAISAAPMKCTPNS